MRLNLDDAAIPEVFGPLGHCMYCDRKVRDLTDEHILPLGLGGKKVLRKASCKDCARITGSVEQKLLRGPLWPLRAKFGLQSGRRKEEQPNDFDQVYWDGEDRLSKRMTVNDMPLTISMPFLDGPCFLYGRPWDIQKERTHTKIRFFREGKFSDDQWIQELDTYMRGFQKRLGGTSIGLLPPIDPYLFRRLISKISLGYVTATTNVSYIPLCKEFILGRRPDLAGHLVGEVSNFSKLPDRAMHGCKAFSTTADDVSYLCCAVNLFQGEDDAAYVSVVGIIPN